MNILKFVFPPILASCTMATLPLFAKNAEIPTDISQSQKPMTIKVLLAKDQEKILIEAKGKHHLYNPLTQMLLDSASSKRGWIRSTENGLLWGDLIPGNFQVRIVPADSKSSLLINGIEYRGCVEIYENQGKLCVINEVDVERYLKSTMAFEAFVDTDDEVLDAIAITARTNAYFLADRKPVAHWHVDAKEVNYQGCALTLQNAAMERAIQNTRFMVMIYQGLPFPAAWTKDSGGKTAAFSSIFRKDLASPQGVSSPYAEYNKEQRSWSFSTSKQEIAQLFGAEKISEISVFQDPESKKIYGVRLKDQSKTQELDFATLQKALGSARLKSNDFQIQLVGDKVLFKGFGEGSGVGLCLFSAQAMSDKGDKAPKILSTFFPETELCKMRPKNL